MQLFNNRLLQRTRLELSLTQEEAAHSLGIAVRTYRRYESGQVNRSGGFSVRHPERMRVVQRILKSFGLREEELIPEEESSQEPARARVVLAHPLPRAPFFVGREGLLGELREWGATLTSPQRIVALVAVGGSGKTSLVERLLPDLSPHSATLFGWSFYEQPDPDAFLAELLHVFGVRERDGAEQRLQEALSTPADPHLLVLDGLEVVQSEGDSGRARGEVPHGPLRRLLRALARGLGQTRLLLTSRFELTDLQAEEGTGLRTIRLEPLDLAESQALLEAWGVNGDPSLQSTLSSMGGHALSVAMLGSYLGRIHKGDLGPLAGTDLEDLARDDVLARRLLKLLQAYAKSLSDPERDLLARLAVFSSARGLDSLVQVAAAGGSVAGSLAGRGEHELALLLSRLEELGLVQPVAEGFTCHPFVRLYFRSLVVDPEALLDLERREVQGSLTRRPSSRPRGPALLDRLEALILQALGTGEPDEAWQIYQNSLGGFEHLALRLGEFARGDRILRAFASSGDASALFCPGLARGDEQRLLFDLARYAHARGQLAEARSVLERSLALTEVAIPAGPTRAQAQSKLLLLASEIQRSLGELEPAAESCRGALLAAQESQEPALIAAAALLFARVQEDLGPSVLAKEARASASSALGQLRVRLLGCRWTTNKPESEDLERLEELRWTGPALRWHLESAQRALLDEGDPEEAEARLSLVRDDLASAEASLKIDLEEWSGWVAIALQRPAQALRSAGAALQLADQGGFRLARVRALALRAGALAGLKSDESLHETLGQLKSLASELAYAPGLTNAAILSREPCDLTRLQLVGGC